MPSAKLKTRLLSSLVKVFPDEELMAHAYESGSMLRNEVYAFQTAYQYSSDAPRPMKGVRVDVRSPLASSIRVRKVGLIPVEMPSYGDHDTRVLRSTPGLYPEILEPLPSEDLSLLPGQWRSLWVTIEPQERIDAGAYPVEMVFVAPDGDELAREVFRIEVIGADLPAQKLVHTEWFHTDCLATYYDVEIFSEAHWSLIDRYMKTAVRRGINMILTPLFTPPLDTRVGGERPTVQLVDVYKKGDRYTFGYRRLKRWVDLCLANGVKYFEFSHFFTQWGAAHAPKIMARENGTLKRVFGWETEAAGTAYRAFLDQFLPSLLRFIRRHGLQHNSYFHVSDEPRREQQASYAQASEILERHLKAFPVMDCLSDFEFYQKGLVRCPIPSTNHIEPFLEAGLTGLWTYYCCGQYKEVSNRFIHFPSARNRVLGLQLYKFRIAGFLQWGYNFWYVQHSRYPIDPYRVTDGGFWVPAGDAFVVYPGKDGPLVSLRLEVFHDALQDMRALALLEELAGREFVVGLLDEGLDEPLTFTRYPVDEAWLLDKREQVNRAIQTRLRRK